MTIAIALSHVIVSAAAIAVQVVGDVQVESPSGTAKLERFAEVPEGASVSTGVDARAALRLPSGSLLRLGPETRISLSTVEIGEPAAQRKESVRVVVGRLWARVMNLMGTESRFEVATNNAVAGVRGTSFWVTAQGDQSEFVLEHGALSIRQGELQLLLDQPGAAATTGGGLHATAPLDMWALAALQRKVGGAGAVLVTQLGGQRGDKLERTLRRGALRRTILAPDRTLDSPVDAGRTGDEVRAVADVNVQLRLPGN